MRALDRRSVALFKALVYGKRPIASLTVVFVHRHAHSLHGYNGLQLLPLKRLGHHDKHRFFLM